MASYEALRRMALGQRGPDDGPSLGLAILLRQGMAAWLRAEEDSALGVRALLPRIHDRFGLDVHPRSLERALRRAEKKRR